MRGLHFTRFSWKSFWSIVVKILIVLLILIVGHSFIVSNVKSIPTASSFVNCSFYSLRTDSFYEFYDEEHGMLCYFDKEINRKNFLWEYDNKFGIVSMNFGKYEDEIKLYTIDSGLFNKETKTLYEKYDGLISVEIEQK